jgi:hypothetical protein
MRPRIKLGPRLAILIASAMLPGCGDDGRVPLYPASGQVRIDGRPESGVEIRLHPADDPGDIDSLKPYATTAEDGSFRLGTHEEADGAPAGRYKLTLFWPDRPPGPSPPLDRLGGQHANPQRTEFEVTITEGENALGTLNAESVPSPTSGPGARRGGPGTDLDGFGGPAGS